METLLTTKDLQELFQCSRGTIVNWEKRGRLKPVHIEGRKYFKQEDIKALIMEEF